ncbi:unnamed protein product, partial [Prorocentrum cordatum]
AQPTDKFFGCLPWKTTKPRQHVCEEKGLHAVQDPDGNVWLVCFNVSKVMGIDLEFDSIQAYLEHIFGNPTKARHAVFMTARQNWIDQHNADPSTVKLRTEAALRAFKQLLTKAKSGHRLTKPKRMFVELAQCIEDFERAPADDEIDEEIADGVVTRGVYLLAPGEKKGYHHVEGYVDKQTEQRTLVDDGEQALSDTQVEQKFQLALKATKEKHDKQDKKLAKQPTMDHPLLGILQACSLTSSGRDGPKRVLQGGEGDDGDSDDTSEASKGSDSEQQQESDTSDDENLRASSGNPFAALQASGSAAALKTAAAARPASSKPKPPASEAGGSKKGGEASSVAGRSPATKRTVAAPVDEAQPAKRGRGRPPTSMVNATATGAAAVESLIAEVSRLATESSSTLTFGETHDLSNKEEQKACKAILVKKKADALNIEKSVSALKARLGKLATGSGLDMADALSDLGVIMDTSRPSSSSRR